MFAYKGMALFLIEINGLMPKFLQPYGKVFKTMGNSNGNTFKKTLRDSPTWNMSSYTSLIGCFVYIT
jgi:hypothetical protein